MHERPRRLMGVVVSRAAGLGQFVTGFSFAWVRSREKISQPLDAGPGALGCSQLFKELYHLADFF